MNKLFKECLVALVLIIAVPKVILFAVQAIQTDATTFEKQYDDFISSYNSSHPDANLELDAEIAWRNSELFPTNSQEYKKALVFNYFERLIIFQAAFIVLIYLGCTLASPIIAAACIMSAGITYYLSLSGMSGIWLWYGMIIEFICTCIGLFFLLRFLYRQSRK